jgi:hypothetical protein
MICLICVHRCHQGHKVIPIGYQISECACSSSLNTCNAIKPLEMPNHVKNANIKAISLIYPTDDEINNLCKVYINNLVTETKCLHIDRKRNLYNSIERSNLHYIGNIK